ncbi:MAG: hypothetical protein HPY53_12420 [Brevinematales bacterium]|nr:hypothetical protein [Brevinematales bacterium]
MQKEEFIRDENIKKNTVTKQIIHLILFSISAFLSIQLFWNFGSSLPIQIVFAVIAVTFELGKVNAYEEFKEGWKVKKKWLVNLIIFIVLLAFSLFASFSFIIVSVKSQSVTATEDNSTKVYYKTKLDDIQVLIDASKDNIKKLSTIATNSTLRKELDNAKKDYAKWTAQKDEVSKTLLSYSSTNKGEKIASINAFIETGDVLGVKNYNIFLGIFLAIIAIMIEVWIIKTSGSLSFDKIRIFDRIKEWNDKRKMKTDFNIVDSSKTSDNSNSDSGIPDLGNIIGEIPALHSGLISEEEVSTFIEKEDLIKYVDILFDMKKSPTAKRLASQEVISRETGWDRKKINEVQERLQNIFIEGVPVIQIEAKSGAFSNFSKEQVREAVINS